MTNKKNYDIVIIGAGIAGLYCALNLNTRFRVLLLSKRKFEICNSALAQGGIAAVLDIENDSIETHIHDTLVAGGYQNNRTNLHILIEQGAQNVKNLQKLGVKFDKCEDGSLSLTLEGGHSHSRIAHKSDSTGFEIISALISQVKNRENITLLENANLLDLCREDKAFQGIFLHKNAHEFFSAHTCILAAGGIGQVYHYTTNSAISTGNGIYFAHKLGAEIKNMNLIQFHPTSFAAFSDSTKHERFLISEAVRGEGAQLLNCNKERFMQKYDVRAELAPRDVVSRGILEEQEATGSTEFFLDITHKDSEFVKNRFPMIYGKLLKCGYDLTSMLVPIYPCQHYLMGGIVVNDRGRTSVRGLYAAGECSNTGVHGVNRLASNSLLEALVFSRRAAEDINESAGSNAGRTTTHVFPFNPVLPADLTKQCRWSHGSYRSLQGLQGEIQKIMQKAYFITPDFKKVDKGLTRITEIRTQFENDEYALTSELTETKSLALIAFLILKELKENNK